MTPGQATLDDLPTDDEDSGDERTPTRALDEAESREDPRDPERDRPREDAPTDETGGATDGDAGGGEGEADDEENVRSPEEIRDPYADRNPDVDYSPPATSSTGGRGTTTCPSCGAESDKCYRCSECGKDLVGVSSSSGRGS